MEKILLTEENPKELRKNKYVLEADKTRIIYLDEFKSLFIERYQNRVPIIVKKYGKEAFQITDKYVKITIPFDPEVMESIGVGGNLGGNNVGNNVGNNQLQNDIIAILLENDRASAKAIAERLNLTARTVERAIAKLKAQGIIERVGGTRGKWIVKK